MAAVAFNYNHQKHSHAHAYLLPAVRNLLARIKPGRIFDLGCGNGSVAAALTQDGYSVTGVDLSPSGIVQARLNAPKATLEIGDVTDDLAARFGQFPCVISLEVIEHLYSPNAFAKTLHDLLEPGGTAIVSTPYHSSLKFLALAASGKMERHLQPWKDGGHIKFFTPDGLRRILAEAELTVTAVHRVGRVRPLAKSMIALAVRAN